MTAELREEMLAADELHRQKIRELAEKELSGEQLKEEFDRIQDEAKRTYREIFARHRVTV